MLENYKIEYYDHVYNEDSVHTQKRKPHYKFKKIMLAVLLCSIAISVTYRYVIITRINYEINKMEKELITINGNNQNLNVKVAETENLSKIEKIARSKLHMHEPTEENIIYVNINNYNVAKTKPIEKSNRDMNFNTFFLKIFGVIIR